MVRMIAHNHYAHQRIATTLQGRIRSCFARSLIETSELAVHLDRAGDQPAAFMALLAAADAAETVAPGVTLRHLERAFELWDAAGPAAAGVRRGDRLWQAAELASGTASNERAAALARGGRFGTDRRRGARRGDTNGSAVTCGRRGTWSRAKPSSKLAAALLPDEVGPDAAAVYVGLGQAEADAGPLRLR